MKKFILLFVFVSAGLLANAQDKTPKADAETRAKNQVAKMVTELGINADQQAKVTPIVLARVKAMETNRATNGSNPNVMGEERKKIQDKFNNDLKTVLTPEQITKLAQVETDMKAKRAEKK